MPAARIRASSGLPPGPGKILTRRAAVPVAAGGGAAAAVELRQPTLQERADALRQIPWTAPARLAHGWSGAAMCTDPLTAGGPGESGQRKSAVGGDGVAPQPPHALIPGGHAYLPQPAGFVPEWELLHQVQLLLSHGVSPTHIAAMMSVPGYFSRALQQAEPAAAATCDHIMEDLRTAASVPARGGAGAAAEVPPQRGGGDGLSGVRALIGGDTGTRKDAAAAGLPTAVGGAAAAGEAEADAAGCARWRELPVPASAREPHVDAAAAAGASSLRGLRSDPRCVVSGWPAVSAGFWLLYITD